MLTLNRIKQHVQDHPKEYALVAAGVVVGYVIATKRTPKGETLEAFAKRMQETGFDVHTIPTRLYPDVAQFAKDHGLVLVDARK